MVRGPFSVAGTSSLADTNCNKNHRPSIDKHKITIGELSRLVCTGILCSALLQVIICHLSQQDSSSHQARETNKEILQTRRSSRIDYSCLSLVTLLE